jgi:hypothetical protein
MSVLLDNAVAVMRDIVTAVSDAGDLVAGSDSFQSTTALISPGLTFINNSFLLADYTLTALLQGTGGAVLNSNANTAITELQVFLLATQDLAGLAAMNGYAQRIVTNLANAGG